MTTTAGGDWYADRVNELLAKSEPSEQDVSDIVVRRVLEDVLRFGVGRIDAQPFGTDRTGRKHRPDYLCRRDGSELAAVIVEAKRLGTSLTKRQQSAWRSSPIGQLHYYLEHDRRSTVGTFGVVTDGLRWIVVRRERDHVPRFDHFEEREARTLDEIREIVADIIVAQAPRARVPTPLDRDGDWLECVARCDDPTQFVREAARCRGIPGRPKAARDAAWLRFGERTTGGRMLPDAMHVVCLRMDFPDGLISPEDIQQELAATVPGGGDAVGVAYTDGAGGGRMCRGFVSVGSRLSTTALVDPRLPGSRAERQFAELSAHWSDPSPDAVDKALSSVALHRRFHEEIGAWFLRTPHGRNELRHLVRVMFAWLLQERGILPDNSLWDHGRNPTSPDAVHGHVEWLFTEVLAKPTALRGEADAPDGRMDDWRRSLVRSVPFLNGSLFAELRQADRPECLANELYLGADGLFEILARYDWTLHDRTGYASESALDPSMLGSMFERLMLETEGPRLEGDAYVHRKMPLGAYYTPQDVADEMAADAIAGLLAARLADAPPRGELRALAHPHPNRIGAWREWPEATRRAARRVLAKATVLDPCCGSGVFALTMLHALCRAKRRLAGAGARASFGKDLEDTIIRQIHAADIHPLAVLITRLRLFIALVDAGRRDAKASGELKPLPNLETRCLVADALAIEPSPTQPLVGAALDEGIATLRAARRAWTEARAPAAKDAATRSEASARAALRKTMEGWRNAEDLAWLDVDFLSDPASPARFDLRLLFPAPKGGWDIVIGNPPYQKPDEDAKRRGKALGYAGAAADLYLMFIEAAAAVAAGSGEVTLVVPHSIVFNSRKAYAQTRRRIEEQARRVDIRTYDNMPQPLFRPLPWLKAAEHGIQNRQRATIVSFTMKRPRERGARRGTVWSGGLHRLTARNREAVLRHDGPRQVQPDSPGQWTQAPTEELAALLAAMRDESPKKTTDAGLVRVVTFPRTAMYYVSCLPEGVLSSERRSRHGISDGKYFWPWVGLYNSSLFHAYWLMVGDAFDVISTQYRSVRPPEAWRIDEPLRKETETLARRLMRKSTLASCYVVKVNSGRPWPNYDFHKEGSRGRPIIEELDGLLLEAYGLERNPLIRQMHTIRAGSAHDLAPGTEPSPRHKD